MLYIVELYNCVQSQSDWPKSPFDLELKGENKLLFNVIHSMYKVEERTKLDGNEKTSALSFHVIKMFP